MKVIQIMPEFGLAGAETMCENLTVELLKRGMDVVVVSMFDYHSAITDRLENMGIKLIYLGKKSGLDLSVIRKLRKILKKEKPDIIHTHRYVMQYAIPAAIGCRIKRRIHTVHNIASKECTPAAQKMNAFFYHHCHVTPVALSEEVKHTIIERYQIRSNLIPVIYNGIDLKKCIVKKSYQFSGIARFLHIGRFTEQKNHKMLLSAFQEVHKIWPETQLDLVGAGELEDEIRGLVYDMKLADCVYMPGVLNNVYPVLNQADVFVLPSVYEGMPMTLIEAMGTGLPIIATNVGGIPTMIDNEKDGLMVDVDVDQIADAMMKMRDAGLRRKLGESAKKKAWGMFSVEGMVDGYIRAYKGHLQTQ